ncbi:MAG: hypothetical protein AB7L66_14710 [Gemmatimonadales bacterium]
MTIALLLLLGSLLPQDPPTPSQAAAVIAAAHRLVADDGGRLWGRSLAGPLLIVDRESGVTYASEPDSAGRFTPIDGVYRGRLPEAINPANTAVEYSGRLWTMVLWPVPDDPAVRRELLAHELWHRIQRSLDLPPVSTNNPHLDTESGRIWFRLEARALAVALRASGKERQAALEDALIFRAARTGLDAARDSAESALERNEGLAEYTGYRLSGRPAADQRDRAAAALKRMETGASIGRSFAYATGPAYGLLLDALRPGWRIELRSGASLTSLVARSVGRIRGGPVPTSVEVRYGGEEIRRAEAEREAKRVARVRELTDRYVIGPVLRIPLEKSEIGFDPGRVESLDSAGTVYGGARLSDAWGVLDATGSAAWVAGNWQLVTVPVDDSFDPARPAGPGWQLNLAAGYEVVRDPNRPGWLVRRKQ